VGFGGRVRCGRCIFCDIWLYGLVWHSEAFGGVTRHRHDGVRAGFLYDIGGMMV
jgi:hypothetical protein